MLTDPQDPTATDDANALAQLEDDGGPPAPDTASKDERSAFDTSTGPALVVSVDISKPQLANLADAIQGDLMRSLGKAADRLRTADRALVAKVAMSAAKVEIDARKPEADPKSIDRKRRNVYAQLCNVRAAAARLSADAFWEIVDAVVTRLTAFVLGAVAKL